ncbi:MAG: response regulator, partial [Alphaproteobacteria bacterium]
RHKDGSYRWLSWVAVPEGDKLYIRGRDITAEHIQTEALEHAQDALRQSQKIEAIGQLTGGVAHDFNNLLTVIRGSVDLLRRPGLSEDRRGRYIDAIADTADRAAKLTGQLLAFARRQALSPVVFDVTANLQAVKGMIGTLAGSRVQIAFAAPDEPCLIKADPSQFDTAIVNMAVNARDAMGGEGMMELIVGLADQIPPVRSHQAVPGTFVTVKVRDSGAGIAPDDLVRIFEPFYTTKGVGQGTGLGLSQVFGFAKQSGGEIVVDSTVDVGTTFTLYLPCEMEGEGVVGPDGEDEGYTDPQGMCVLLVEDNADVGLFATATLAELGYSTVYAENADAALRELDKGADRFDVVFSDVVMPGMSGLDMAKVIRERHPDLPVALTSGYSHVLAEKGSGGFELLHKPYSMEQVSRFLRKVARQRMNDTVEPV